MENIRQKVLLGVFWKFCERFLSQIVSFVVSIVIARILMPSDYGVVAIVNVFIVIANIFVVSGFTSALIQKRNADDCDFSTLFYCSLIISILSYFALFFLAPFISRFYGTEELTSVFRVFALILPISSYNAMQNAYIAKNMQFKKNFWGTFLGTCLSGVLGIVLALNGFGVWALVFQYLSNNIVNGIVLFFLIDWKPKLYFSINRAKPLLKFGMNILAADFVGTIFNQLNTFIIGKKYSVEQLAYYNRGQSFPYLVNGNMCSVLANVLYPAFSAESNNDDKLVSMARKTVRLSVYALSPLFLGLAAVGENMIKVLLTDKWLEAYPFLIIICISCLFSAPSTIALQLLKAKGRSDIVFHLEFVKKPLWVIMTICALFVGVKALACVLILVGVEEMVVNAIAVRRILNYSFFEHMKDVLFSLAPSVMMFLLIYPIQFWNVSCYVLFPLQIFLGALFFVLLAVLTKNQNFLYLYEMVKRRKM